MVDVDQDEPQAYAALDSSEEKAQPHPPTSPLIKLIEAITGKKKTVTGSPQDKNTPEIKNTPQQAQQEQPPPTTAQQSNAQMPAGPLMTVVTRNEFYRDGFRSLIKIALVQAIIIVGLITTFLYYMSTAVSENRYFATTADGRIIQLIPLANPNMEVSALLSWASQSASEVMTFSYHDYQRRLQQSSRHFTRHGWETFTTALQKSRILQGVQEYKQIVSATPKAAPVLVQQGVFNGKYRWIVRLPLQVAYEGGVQRRDNLNLTLVIERVPSLENPNGVGIEQWIAVATGN